LPASLINTVSLEVLQLHDNNLTGSVPSVKALVNLVALSLSNNPFNSPMFALPSEELTTLSIENCGLTGAFDLSGDYTTTWKLEKVEAAKNKFDKWDVGNCDIGCTKQSAKTSTFPSLTDLDLSHNQLTEVPMTFFGNRFAYPSKKPANIILILWWSGDWS
jgi:Leucine-rich repeat (LRR) protein